MGCYHFHLTQLSRGHGQSAIASAAYRSGEKLYSSYYGETNDYTRKGGVILSEIHLPDHAPERFKDRETLWNELEWEESNKKAQLAHSFDIAFMNEFSMEENIELARRFVREQLVSRGMIVDLAIHDPERLDDKEPNPHMHIMVPIRPLKKDGTWDVKQKKIPILKEDGTPILNKNGKPKTKAVPVNDWSSKETLMELRKAWANLCNELYEEKGLSQRVDWRSYEELGVNQIPTVHEGPTVRAMEAKGMETALGSLNRMIRKFNQMLQDAKELLWKAMFQEGQLQEKMMLAKKPTIAEYLMEYYEQRNEVAETFAYGTQKAKTTNLKEFTTTISFLQREHIDTPDELTARMQSLEKLIREKKKGIEDKATTLSLAKEGIRAWDEYQKMQPIYDELNQKKWFKEKYKEEHKSELNRYYRARRVLQENRNDDGKVPVHKWEYDKSVLPGEIAALKEEKDALFRELKTYQKIQKNIESVLDDKNESSVLEALEKRQVEVKQREAEKPKKRNRGMEL